MSAVLSHTHYEAKEERKEKVKFLPLKNKIGRVKRGDVEGFQDALNRSRKARYRLVSAQYAPICMVCTYPCRGVFLRGRFPSDTNKIVAGGYLWRMSPMCGVRKMVFNHASSYTVCLPCACISFIFFIVNTTNES